MGRDFNDQADKVMVVSLRIQPAADLNEIILRRLEQSRAYKPAVARLAASDLFHPFDTLGRTATTAGLMLAAVGGSGAPLRRWRLVLAYCIVVLVWLTDRSADQRTIRRAVRAVLSVLGVK